MIKNIKFEMIWSNCLANQIELLGKQIICFQEILSHGE